ncbi:hypothetical protein EFV37_22075 [Mesorhizobium loti]|uniref:Uncharacterized protein n=1 Tax=Mesorhizobium jarvisii TaxID=1777867 RepID=A0A6M7TL93_9HYPH|nr:MULTISPECIES: hypothetical protein [Mesorhizobium]OBQ59589.1 hypothetical protein A9K72_25595 [Mesorhizobium loti]QKC64673.1 hypothetical protein EB229_22070 [Mesorhizobium jarvisii]QKD10587.1 hypothetical protein EFV37_22075 [Mesorhizobium loti]RJT30577.1 hypothetical protein D3242_24705 [Mesorhizobium jarvisii]
MAKAQTQTGSKAIRAAFADAKRAKDEADALNVIDPDPNLPREGINPGQWPGAPFDNMPPDCPVKVVGRDSEGLVYCISTTGNLRKIERWDMPALSDLFAPKLNTLFWSWPGFGKKKVYDADTDSMVEKLVVNRVERDKAMMAIINEAARKPDFDPHTQHRGRGGWQDSHGRFVWHSGGWLWMVDGKRLEQARPAQHDGFLYTKQAGTIEPWAEPVTQEESPARRILEDLQTWNWQRPYLDPVLVLGWIGTALMGGALKARPIIFATGGAGVGKSRLQEVVRSALAGAVTQSVNTTAAGIYQRAKTDSLPFMIDELESKPGSTRAESVIELARVAYTGGDISRGGQDHEATTFTARNSFFFSAIIPPPMGAQDKTRMAMLNLSQLDRPGKSGRDLVLKPETDGRMILRQIMDGWKEFNDVLMPDMATILGEQGMSARAIDTFGTLLAAARLLVGDKVLEEIGLPVADASHLGELIAEATSADRTENLDHWHKCIDTLFQSQIDAWRDGVKPTIGGVCELLRIGPQAGGWDAKGARERLELVSLGCFDRGKVDANAGAVLAVPASGPALHRIFGDTDFHKGGWYTALKQAPKGIVLPARKVKINGSTTHCLLIDLEAFERHVGAGL